MNRRAFLHFLSAFFASVITAFAEDAQRPALSQKDVDFLLPEVPNRMGRFNSPLAIVARSTIPRIVGERRLPLCVEHTQHLRS